LVKRLVTQHGGEISLRNDGGAVFSVRLPRVPSADTPTSSEAGQPA
jgi:signal transduction histidine kinase